MKKLEWSRLKVIDAVARTGSVTRAAELLHLTGPAVSQQLRRIEQEVGTPVVTADGRGLRLTDAGTTLAAYARQVSELMQRAENDLSSSAPVTGTVRIGAIASSIRTHITRRMDALQSHQPGIVISIEDGETDDHLERLRSGHLDLVVAESWTNAPLSLPAGVVSTLLSTQSTFVALPRGHRSAPQQTVDITELSAETWSTCARGSRDHEALVQAARTRGLELDIHHFVADPLTQLDLVAHSLAIACLAYETPPDDTEDLVFRRFSPTTTRHILLLSDDRVHSRPVETVRDALVAE